jgi:hypothetical protein
MLGFLPTLLLSGNKTKELSMFKKIFSKIKKKFRKSSNELFAGDDMLFKTSFSKDTVYGEYGCGASTIWVSNTIGCEVFSVDSSKNWINFVHSKCKQNSKLISHLADVGPIGSMGRPLGYSRLENFNDYTDWIWMNDKKPNLVLVDGRFRVCCFLTSLIFAEKGTKIFFDDYTNRPHYHFVEKFIKPSETCGRQALFIVPKRGVLDIRGIKEAIVKFRFVFD